MEEIEKLEKEHKLTPKQELFCQEYIQCLNQTLAYMRAYKTDNREQARKYASALMTNQDIKKRVDELKAEIIQKYQITREQLIEKAMWVVNKASEGTPEMKLNRDGKFVPTGNMTYDYRAINDAVKNMAAMCGFNSTEIKAALSGSVESNVNVITAKDIANELMKK